MGSGKDLVADFIMNRVRGTKKYNIGDMIRSISPVFSATDRWEGNERGLYHLFTDKLKEIDENILNLYTMGKIINDAEVTVPIVVGGRTPQDYEFYKERQFFLVGIRSDAAIREERLVKRDGEAQLQHSHHNTEKHVRDIVEKCDFIMDNNGSIEELHSEICKLLSSLQLA